MMNESSANAACCPVELGVAAFGKHIEETDILGWSQYVKDIAELAMPGERFHVQFLLPSSDAMARELGKMARDNGLAASLLWCTIAPVCPTSSDIVEVQRALDIAHTAIDRGRILAGDGTSPNMVFSPSVFCGLGFVSGLAPPEMFDRQVNFMDKVADIARAVPGTVVLAEPLNRFETAGPNRIAEAVRVINTARACDVVRIGADSCHQVLGEISPVCKVWAEHAEMIGMIHASARSRTWLYGDESTGMPDAFSVVGSHGALSKVPVVVEAFSKETNPAFFSLLRVHAVSNAPMLKVFYHNLRELRKWMNPFSVR